MVGLAEAEDMSRMLAPLRPILLKLSSVSMSNYPAAALEFRLLFETVRLITVRSATES